MSGRTSTASTPSRIRNRYGNFAQIPDVLVLDPSVSDRAIRVYALLWTYSSEKGRRVWPSRREMAEVLNVSVSTIDRGLRELEERGAISIEADFKGDRRTSNIYTILVLSETARVVHRGRKSDAPQLSTGAANLRRTGAANLREQEQEPQEQEISSPVPEVTSDADVNEPTGTGPKSTRVTPKVMSATHGLPLQPADVFASCGRWLPDTFDDVALEQLAAEIIGRAASRVLDPTAYVITTIRSWHRPNLTGDDLADVGEWAMRVDEIALNREFVRLTGRYAEGSR